MIPVAEHAVQKIRAVLFDLDRTLLDRDSALLAYARRLWTDAGTNDIAQGAAFVTRFVELDARGKADKHVYFRQLKNEFALNGDLQEMLDRFELTFPSTVRPFPGTLELLQELKRRHFFCGVITNGHSRGQREKLQRSGFFPFLDTILISKEVGIAKPDPKIFRIALRAVGCRANETLFVGDSEEADVAGARNAGLRSVLFRPFADTSPTSADHVIHSLTELDAILRAFDSPAQPRDRRADLRNDSRHM